VRKEGVPGHWLEAGVALGGSAILLSKLKPAATRLDLYDVFAMIPPPGENDGQDAHARYAEISSGASAGLGGEPYYGYVDNLLERVKDNLRRFDIEPERGTVRCIPGLFEDTLQPAGPVALAHTSPHLTHNPKAISTVTGFGGSFASIRRPKTEAVKVCPRSASQHMRAR
jgi:asparagine synthase (glutamine-hydrolysing)